MGHHDFQVEKGCFSVLFDLQLSYFDSQIGKTRVPTKVLVYPDRNTSTGSMYLSYLKKYRQEKKKR